MFINTGWALEFNRRFSVALFDYENQFPNIDERDVLLMYLMM